MFAIKDESLAANGVAWLENKIYVVCRDSSQVHVYPDQEPFDELEDDRIEIKGMIGPVDMAVSDVSQSIFISDYSDTHRNHCVWKIQMPSRGISRWEIDDKPMGLTINSSDELIVVVNRDNRSYLNMYRCLDGEFIKSMSLHVPILVASLPDDFGIRVQIPHVVQSSTGTFIVLHTYADNFQMPLISEVSIDGTKIIRTFDPRLIDSKIWSWRLPHLSINEHDNIFVADFENDRVVLLNPRLDEHQILVNRDEHQIREPTRLCYVREKQMLIVGHRGSSSSVSLFSVSMHRQ